MFVFSLMLISGIALEVVMGRGLKGWIETAFTVIICAAERKKDWARASSSEKFRIQFYFVFQKMYSELEVQFLTDECDTVLAYENKGTSDQETERRDPLMDTLNSMNRVQQVELICGKYCFFSRAWLSAASD